MIHNQAESETMEHVLNLILSINKEDATSWHSQEHKQKLRGLRSSIEKLPIAEIIICATIYNNKFINPTNNKDKELKITFTEKRDTLVGYNTVTRKIKESYTRALNCLCDSFGKEDKDSFENFLKIDGQLNEDIRNENIQSLKLSKTKNGVLYNNASDFEKLEAHHNVKAIRSLKDLNVDEFLSNSR